MEKERSHADSRITQRRPSPPIHRWSRSPGIGGRDPSERVAAINWNEWSRSIGIAGRDLPVRAGEHFIRDEASATIARLLICTAALTWLSLALFYGSIVAFGGAP